MRGDVLTLTKSCLKSLGKMLKHTLELPTGSIQATHLCEAVASVLSIILSQSLYLIPGSVDDIDSLEVFLRTFHEEIFRPAIKGFVLLCEHRAPRQSDAAKKSAIDRPLPKSDIRPILLAICQSGIETMKLKPGVYESLCLLVAYTTTIHIQQEIHHRPPAAAARKREAQPAIEKHRTCQSTSRDGLWYLMALLNTSICILHPHSSPIEVATRDGIVDMLLQLLEPGDDHRQLTLIEENMVLGIAEKAWAAGWFPTCTPKEEVEPIINAVFPSSSTISDE